MQEVLEVLELRAPKYHSPAEVMCRSGTRVRGGALERIAASVALQAFVTSLEFLWLSHTLSLTGQKSVRQTLSSLPYLGRTSCARGSRAEGCPRLRRGRGSVAATRSREDSLCRKVPAAGRSATHPWRHQTTTNAGCLRTAARCSSVGYSLRPMLRLPSLLDQQCCPVLICMSKKVRRAETQLAGHANRMSEPWLGGADASTAHSNLRRAAWHLLRTMFVFGGASRARSSCEVASHQARLAVGRAATSKPKERWRTRWYACASLLL
ncbi:hypothetical protein K466DRAFT_185922 [Polyporus arcularius HHB13444]|uniref:Uncharacterized protein n=1 Tax=Polyporus arcularius HHB13444 TaxID=1314778 RepID=A0A5C3P877_9APHY|nr:hypothetical protein K466DRAFT_185922 [Polyporus arcularius HHB13444]